MPKLDLAAVRTYALRVARKYFDSPEDAEDVAQETVLAAHQHLGTFRGESELNSWIYAIARSKALNVIRKRRARPACESLTTLDEDGAERHLEPASPVDLREQAIAREGAGIAAAAVGHMGEKHAAVFWLRYGGGASESEVARELGLTVAAVKARAHRARRTALAALGAA